MNAWDERVKVPPDPNAPLWVDAREALTRATRSFEELHRRQGRKEAFEALLAVQRLIADELPALEQLLLDLRRAGA